MLRPATFGKQIVYSCVVRSASCNLTIKMIMLIAYHQIKSHFQHEHAHAFICWEHSDIVEASLGSHLLHGGQTQSCSDGLKMKLIIIIDK